MDNRMPMMTMVIVILSIAIIPMVAMFDMGLKSATLGGNYDKARALANAKLEEAKALPYSNAVGGNDSLLERYKPTNEPASPGGPVPCDSGAFDCEVTTRYLESNLSSTPSPAARTSWIEIKVEIEWDGGTKSYQTTGLKVK